MNRALWTNRQPRAHRVRRLGKGTIGLVAVTAIAIALLATLVALDSCQGEDTASQEPQEPQEGSTLGVLNEEGDVIGLPQDFTMDFETSRVEVPGGGVVGTASHEGDFVFMPLDLWTLASQELAAQEIEVPSDAIVYQGDDFVLVTRDAWALWAFSQEGAIGGEQNITTESYSSPPDTESEIDPVAVALGLTKDETHALYSLHASARANVQSALAEHPELLDLLNGTTTGADISDEARASVDGLALRVIATGNALEMAVEELWNDLSRTDEASAFVEEWSRCMADRGYIYDSPIQIETDLRERRHAIDSVADLLESRDRCYGAGGYTAASNRLVLPLIPEWQSEHSALLSAYREALDLYESSLQANE